MNDGGPAFPCEGGELSGLHAHPGMSLWDYFAGQALAGLAVVNDKSPRAGGCATLAYELADAMLKARSARQAGGGDGDC